MPVPESLRQLLDAELSLVRQEEEHQFPLHRRIALYDALGESFPEPTALAPARRAQEGILSLTTGDRIRARLAILTAHHVLPIWYQELEDAGLLSAREIDRELRYLLEVLIEEQVVEEEQEGLLSFLDSDPIDLPALRAAIAALPDAALTAETRQIMGETIESSVVVELPADALAAVPVWRKSLNTVWTKDIPAHLLALAEAALQGGADIQRIFEESCEAHEILGRYFGYDEDDFPEMALLVAEAAYEALNMALGIGWYKTFKVDKATAEHQRLLGRGPTEQLAGAAYATHYDMDAHLWRPDPQRLLEFWTWWLTEAIPTAWDSET